MQEVATGRSRSRFFPRGVRLWHFIVLPAVGMAILLGISRLIDDTLATDPAVAHSEWYQGTRTAVIAVGMSSLMAWLAFNYRRGYERQLQARNEELEAARDFLTGIFDGSAEAILTLDHENRVTSWNKAAQSIYGWTAAEMIGQTIERLRPRDAEIRDAMAEVDRRVLDDGESVEHFETKRLRKDGAPITVHVTRTPLYDPQHRSMGMISMEHDVTGVREMEAKLQEQACLAAVGQLAASVAHEIKNPLAGIRGACEIIADGYEDADPKKEMATEVLRQVDRLNRTVQELLVFARPLKTKTAVVDLHVLIERVLRVLGDDAQNRDVRFEPALAGTIPPVLADPQQIEQVLFNLLLNAVQATEYRGTVRIVTERDDAFVRIQVADDGPGVPDEVRSQIFEPFFTTRSKGTGLGLAIVQKILDGHGGTIAVESEAGKGATFTIALPVAA